MFCIGRKSIINPEISKYIREQTYKFTNKTMEKYLKKGKENLVMPQNKDLPNCCNFLPFVSFFSFFLGYNFCYYTIK